MSSTQRKFLQWEYSIDRQVVTEAELDKHGVNGWELVSYTPGAGGFPGTAVFKRPVPEKSGK